MLGKLHAVESAACFSAFGISRCVEISVRVMVCEIQSVFLGFPSYDFVQSAYRRALR